MWSTMDMFNRAYQVGLNDLGRLARLLKLSRMFYDAANSFI